MSSEARMAVLTAAIVSGFVSASFGAFRWWHLVVGVVVGTAWMLYFAWWLDKRIERSTERYEAERIIERFRSGVKLAYPDDMTPSGKRVFDSIIESEVERLHEP